jgi:hypothetical protein
LLLAEVPHARLQLEHSGPGGRKLLQLFAIPLAGEGDGIAEQVFWGPGSSGVGGG